MSAPVVVEQPTVILRVLFDVTQAEIEAIGNQWRAALASQPSDQPRVMVVNGRQFEILVAPAGAQLAIGANGEIRVFDVREAPR